MASHPPPRFDAKLWEGRRAIFREKWIISHVRVHTIKTEPYLSAKLDVIPMRGLYGKEGPATTIGCVWEYLFIDEHIWVDEGYCRWRLFFEPQVIDGVLSIASSFPADAQFEPYDVHYQALIQPLKLAEISLFDDSPWDIPPRVADEQMANDFAHSWVAVEQFFQDLPPSLSMEYLLNFVKQLHGAGYDRKLRAGQSLCAFVVSRSSRHSLRPDQPSIVFRFYDTGMDMIIRTYAEASTCRLEPLVSPPVIDALERLIRHPID